MESSISAKIRTGIDISTSTMRLRIWSNQPRDDGGEYPQGAADDEGEQGGEERDADRVAGAVDQAGENVASRAGRCPGRKWPPLGT